MTMSPPRSALWRTIRSGGFQLNALWLDQAFRRLLEKHSLVPQHFAAWANRHLFDDIGLLLNGIDAWLQSDHVKAGFLVCQRRVMG